MPAPPLAANLVRMPRDPGTALAASRVIAAVVAVAAAAAGAPSIQAASTPAQADGIVVCVDTGDGALLRLAADGAACGPGARRVVLAPPDRMAPDMGCVGCPAAEPSRGHRTDALAMMDRRIAALERAASFEVIDRRGRRILAIASGQIVVFNGDGAPVAALLATLHGGVLKAQAADATRVVSFGAGGTSGGLRIEEGDAIRLDLGRQAAGNYALRITRREGQLAGIGESRAQSGALLVGDGEGRLRAALRVVDGKGTLDVFDGGGTAVGSLGEGKTGGVFTIADRAGNGMVQMGVNDGRYGVVLAGTRAGFPLVPSSGLPGSYFLGCAAGPSCRP